MRVLLIGYDPKAVDFSDPGLPPGLDAAKIQAGIDLAMQQMRDRGWQADHCLVRPDQEAGPTIERQLRSATYDCVVIGGGVRLSKYLEVFEVAVNAVHKGAPGAAIAFNTRPENSAEAVERWVRTT